MYLSIILIPLAVLACTGAQPALVETVYGPVQGYVDMFLGQPLNVFLGIPFAKPPTGIRRLRPPVRLDSWDDIRDATAPGPACPQASGSFINQDEDCLYLNVFVPGQLPSADNTSLPVMVFIHGGAFVQGSAYPYNGSVVVTQSQPVIWVAIQYRLGLLGFATSGDDEIAGNFGLKDQLFALEWVQENIATFGGDSNQVTIVGLSAGAESILLHMVNPQAEGLFQRAIVQSAPAAWRYPQKEVFQELFYSALQEFQCPPSMLWLCIQALPWQQMARHPLGALAVRVIDGDYLSAQPWQLFQSGYVNTAPLLIGFTNDDGSVIADILDVFDDNVTRTGISDEALIDSVLSRTLLYLLSDISVDILRNPNQTIDTFARNGQNLTNLPQLLALLKGKYVDDTDPIVTARGILDTFRDAFFVVWASWIIEQVSSRGNDVHVYSFDHRSDYLGASRPGEVPLYAPHGSDVRYSLGLALISDVFSEEEGQLARSMIHAWTSFAATGQPSFLTMHDDEVVWPLYEADDPRYVSFDVNMTQESVKDFTAVWQPISDFLLAVQSVAVFEGDVSNSTGSNDEERDRDEDSSSEEFESNILKLKGYQADIAVILLLSVVLLPLLTAIGLSCHVCCRSKPEKSVF